MSKEGSGASKNGKPNAGFGMQSEKSASWNKKSTESKSNGSEKSENGSWNTNASVASEPEKNVSKSVCGACSGMQRSSASENNAWHASSNGWRGELLLLQPPHRPCPRYWLTLSLSHPFPSRLSYKPTREKVRAFGMRRSRYIGNDKTHLQHVSIAAAMNIVRFVAWLDGDLPAPTRVTPFQKLCSVA
jgi:hypothetical protein